MVEDRDAKASKGLGRQLGICSHWQPSSQHMDLHSYVNSVLDDVQYQSNAMHCVLSYIISLCRV